MRGMEQKGTEGEPSEAEEATAGSKRVTFIISEPSEAKSDSSSC